MCNNRYYDAISVGVSILVGIAITVLAFFGFIATGIIAPIIGLALGVISLLVLIIAAQSILRQSADYSACLCRRSVRLLISALWLMIVSALALVLVAVSPVVTFLIGFFIYTLISYTLFSLYCFMRCLLRTGCAEEDVACAAR